MMLCVHGSPLYQWDINRQLLIDSADLGSEFVIHCCYTEDSNALVVEPKINGDKVLANIPNILLQRHGNLRVYVVTEGDTVYDATFYVMARPKPDDYVYTETEVLSYVSLSKRMDELEKNGVSEDKIAKAVGDYLTEHPITESDPTVPAWAKESEKPKYTADEVGALPKDTPIPSIDGLATEKYVDEKVAGIKIPESGTTDYTNLKNKPKINGVELDGDKTLEALGIPTGGGGFGLTIFNNYDVELITQNFNIDQENLPKNIEITQKDDGTPFEYDGLMIWTDVKDVVSYNTLRLNDSPHIQCVISGNRAGMDIVIVDGETAYIHAHGNYPKVLYKQSYADTNKTFFPEPFMQYMPTKITSFSFGKFFEIKSVTFYKVWGLKKK